MTDREAAERARRRRPRALWPPPGYGTFNGFFESVWLKTDAEQLDQWRREQPAPVWIAWLLFLTWYDWIFPPDGRNTRPDVRLKLLKHVRESLAR